ncbi:uncharacterized protein LOC100121212 isoform X1 [Nasonia vitripennis]|uniref:Uncharacterized protein n=1 Tax=Nasonia vitripennis TaxID=7425 RepID=A0A7M7T8C9_NASVI|nr:uncharacterized protein LOC100121212 isoform X1 [Nasonia vitripennis]
MSRRTVLLDMRPSVWLLLFATLATLARGFPAPQEDEDSSGPLPFLQFTKGGIRVNFGGYHAQAGLGGLLTGRRADGGLHASAGTPNGAHASAGLGGSLSDGPLGGLHARAGLGNGGPEAEAGLGGTLAGPRPRGEIYANSSPGAGFVASDKTNYIEKTDGVGKNIQVIVRPKKASEQEASATADATANVNSGIPVTSLKEPSSSSSTSASSSGATANAGASATDGSGNAAEDKRSQLPARFYFQKRARERAGGYSSPALREPSSTTTHNAIAASASAGASSEKDTTSPGEKGSQGATASQPQSPGVFVRATAAADDSQSGTTATGGVGVFKRKSKGSLFDDIFNIPISALNAVNQLLRNHVGKK